MSRRVYGVKDWWALITGASGGIGYELAKLFARDHYNLVLVARSSDRLESSGYRTPRAARHHRENDGARLTAAWGCYIFSFDQLQREEVVVDVLVNNAGFGGFGEFASMPEEEILGQVHLNITALTYLTPPFPAADAVATPGARS